MHAGRAGPWPSSSPLYHRLWAALGTWWLFSKSSLEKGSVDCFAFNFKQTSLTIKKKKRLILEPELRKEDILWQQPGIHEFNQDDCRRTHSLPHTSRLLHRSYPFRRVWPESDRQLIPWQDLQGYSFSWAGLLSAQPSSISSPWGCQWISASVQPTPLWPPMMRSSVRHLLNLGSLGQVPWTWPWAHLDPDAHLYFYGFSPLYSVWVAGLRSSSHWTDEQRSACIHYLLN